MADCVYWMFNTATPAPMLHLYSPWLVALSIVVAVLASFTSLGLAGRVAESHGTLARTWVLVGAVAMGIGIWSMHFIGMLAYSSSMPVHYELGLTLASLGVAMLTSAFALRTASGASLGISRHAGASVLMGSGIAAMHYMGMAAMRMNPPISYDPPLVALSLLIAFVASFAAIGLTFRIRTAALPFVHTARLGAAALMGIAIAGMHYTAMAASHIEPGAVSHHAAAVDSHWLAITVGLATVGLLSITLVTLVFDGHIARRAHLHAQSLQQAAERLNHQTTHDALTDLPNRATFIDALRRATADRKEQQQLTAVMLVDLDRFKPVNDSLGHVIGDAVLREVAQRLRVIVGDAGMVARLGADEFLVMASLPGTRDVILLADRIVQRLGQAYVSGATELHMAASVGVTTFPFDHSVADVLVSHADEAMYEAKHAGGNGYRVFVPGTPVYTPDRIELENDLWHAVERRQLELHYQPQVDVTSGRILGLEALVRWQHPTRGMVPPGLFVPLAEASDIIQQLGGWILDEVCRQVGAWRQLGFDDIRVAVNLSVRQFRQPDLVATIQQAIERNGLEPRHIELEVTESSVMSDVVRAREILTQLNNAGLRIAVDDFGTGYSSMSYLKELPVNYLKIDRSFVSELGRSSRSDAIVKAVIELAHGLGMGAIAEGVESAVQLGCLREFGCDQYQGFYFSRALRAGDVPAWLRRSPRHMSDAEAVQTLLESVGRLA